MSQYGQLGQSAVLFSIQTYQTIVLYRCMIHNKADFAYTHSAYIIYICSIIAVFGYLISTNLTGNKNNDYEVELVIELI